MSFFKISIWMSLFFIMGCSSNATSKELTDESGELTLSADNYRVKIKSCSLKIPSRYKLIEFSHHQPNDLDKRVNPDNKFSYKAIVFSHKDVENEDRLSVKNLILSHNIHISNNNFSNMNLLTSKLQYISNKNISDINISRYKPKKLKIDKNDSLQLRNAKLSKLNNTLIVSGKDFTIIVNETDEYIDEIYKLIENCTSRGR